MVVFSTPKIKFKTKMCLMSAMIAWLCLPFCTSTILVQFLYPFNIPLYLDCLQTWLGASATYLYVIGYIRQFPIHRSSWLRILIMMPEIIIASTVSVVLENIAVITMWFGNWYGFYIVQKEVESDPDVESDIPKIKIPKLEDNTDNVIDVGDLPTTHPSPTPKNNIQSSVIDIIDETQAMNMSAIKGV